MSGTIFDIGKVYSVRQMLGFSAINITMAYQELCARGQTGRVYGTSNGGSAQLKAFAY